MKLLSVKIKLVLIGTTVLGLALVMVARYGGACCLSRVTLNGRELDHWNRVLPGLDSASVLSQPLDRLAGQLLADPDVFKVDAAVSGLHSVAVTTNQFAPACFVVHEKSGRLMALDCRARLVPLPHRVETWEHPVLTDCGADHTFRRCRDTRVATVVAELGALRSENRDLYRLIDEVSFGHPSHLRVALAGAGHHLKVPAERLADCLQRYAEFVLRYRPDLAGVRCLDLRCENMIICSAREG